MDIVSPFPVTGEEYKYILVFFFFMEYLSRYSKFCPIKDKISVSIAEELFHRVITRHSCPRVLLSDNNLLDNAAPPRPTYIYGDYVS